MEKIEKVNPNGYNWLKNVPPHEWARWAFDRHVKNQDTCKNFSKSFDNWILNGREKSIISLIESIRLSWMAKIHSRRSRYTEDLGLVCPKIQDVLEKNRLNSRVGHLISVGNDEFEVSIDDASFAVYLREKRCSCGEWELTGIPCIHAVKARRFKRQDPHEYCDPCFHRERAIRIYSHFIHPLSDQFLWPLTNRDPVEPPIMRRMAGRPRKARVRDTDEAPASLKTGGTVKCSRCKQIIHNKRSCRWAPQGVLDMHRCSPKH
ncbi:hypothetical protein QJS04_geneDACA024221 [Acorus gramineus]|uniref:SWIM-type domain-containing protein n=1 Tax=Acorus gramineus TaxID=55184 RepID=A0AAV8ZXG5_ACOGR|nr:hypothetical protein QJS04_geneDACA024221 [Acorus gramineus]